MRVPSVCLNLVVVELKVESCCDDSLANLAFQLRSRFRFQSIEVEEQECEIWGACESGTKRFY